MIAALAIEDSDGNIAPAVFVGPDGSLSPIATNEDGTAPCCCGGQCPGSDAVLCGSLTLSPETAFINGDLFAYTCPQSGPPVFYYIDGLTLAPFNMVVSNGFPGSFILFGCSNVSFTLRIEREGDPTDRIFTTTNYFYDISFVCEDGVLYVLSAVVQAGGFLYDPYPPGTPHRIFYFDAFDDANAYFNPQHPAQFASQQTQNQKGKASQQGTTVQLVNTQRFGDLLDPECRESIPHAPAPAYTQLRARRVAGQVVRKSL